MKINDLKQLLEIKSRFQPYITNPKLSYTFLAPKDEKQYEIFYMIAAEQPTWTSSMYEVLSDDQLILRLLIENFPLDTEMEIYVSSNDCFSSIRIKCTLQEYIKREKIAFTY